MLVWCATAPGRLAARLVAWGRRPGGRLTLQTFATLALLGAIVYTALYVVPSAEPVDRTAEESLQPDIPTIGRDPYSGPQIGEEELSPDEILPSSPSELDTPSTPLARPQDALAAWAARLEPIGIPRVALQAYGYAELTMQQIQPECRLSWTTLAGIGRIESNHGRFNGAELLLDGRSRPPVVGLPLDGGPQRMRILDTDDGRLDNDPVYDRAVGPMQFIPTTWERWGVDGDQDGQADPYDIDDAALAAARYLCANNRDLSNGEDWREAILSYNNLEQYVRDVFNAADEYGRASHNLR